MSPTPTAAAPSAVEPATGAQRARVWLAEDSAWELAHARDLLAGAHDVETFSDGAVLLERLARPDVAPPDLLLLDWHMAGVSGLEVCRFLRERFSPSELPILVLTASTDEGDLEEAFGAGANDFVAKPARRPELLARVRTLLAARQYAERLQTSEARYRALFESIDDGYCLMQLLFDAEGRPVDYRFLETNAAFEAHTGLHGAVGRTARELVPTLDASWFELYGKVALTGQAMRFENDAPAMGRSFEVFATRVEAPALRQVALVFKDITARRAAEAQREESLARERATRAEAEAQRTRLEALFQSAPAFVCTLRGPEHVFDMVNPLYRQLVGTQRELVGLSAREALPEVVGQGFFELLDRVYRSGEPFIGREVSVRLDRGGDGHPEDVFVDFVYQPRRDALGEVDGIDVFGFEVTEGVRARQRVEALAERLRESEERLRRVVEASGTATWELDAATRTFTGDAQQAALMGQPAPQRQSLAALLEAVHPEDRERAQRAIDAAFAGENGGRYHVELRPRVAEGAPAVWLEGRGQVLFDEGGRPLRLVGTSVDITARKEAEAVQARLLAAIADQPLLGVAFLRGPRHVFELANAPYRTIVGGRDVVGKPVLEALPELAGQGIDTLMQRVLETGEPHIGRELHLKLDRRGQGPEDVYYNFVYQAVRGASEANDGVLILVHDVTDEVRAREQAQRQQQERLGFEQQLIGIVSHDLRNPLAAIRLSAQTLLRGEELDARTTRAALRVQTSSERALRLVRDLLDFTRARMGSGIPVVRQPLDLHALVRSSLEELEATHPERELRLVQEGSGQGSWDGDRLAQVVENLVSNALKYSPEGTPVQVTTLGEDGQVRLEVHNVGAPIAPELLQRIFEPLQRATGEVDRQGRSVGLGLYIVKHLVEAHGGHIEVRSTQQEGTTFTVRLPRA